MSNIDDDLNNLLEKQGPEATAPSPGMARYAPVSAKDLADAEAEATQEAKYGDRPLEAAAGSAAAAATLGLSDVALRGLGVPAERLSEVRERSPIASGAGTIAGITAPLVLSGGAAAPLEGASAISTAAKVARSAAELSPINLAAKAGQATEAFAGDILKNKIRSKAAKEILSKATGMAAEGALLNEGNLVDEAALGKADLTAQNVIASGGAGALLGAGFGTALGTAQAAIPFASKAMKPLAEKLEGYASDFTDPAVAMQEISGLGGKNLKTILRRNPEFFNDAVTYTNNELEHGVLTTPSDMYASNAKALARNGKAIESTINELEAAAETHPELALSREQVYGTNLRDTVLKDLRESLSGTAELNSEKYKVIDNFDELLTRYQNKPGPVSLKELDSLRKDLQKMKYKFGGTEVNNNKADVANVLRGGIRDVIDSAAKSIGAGTKDPALKDIALRLEQANKNYSIGSTLEPGLYKRASKGGSNVKLMDIVEGAAAHSLLGPTGLVIAAGKKVLNSDLRRNFMILTDMQRQATHTAELIKTSVNNFINKTKKPIQSISLKALVGSGYAMDDNKQAPKNRKEAFKNISDNLTALQADPDILMNRLAKSTARIATAAPNIADQMQQTLATATAFLASKLPKPYDSGSGSMFPKEYQPTSMELAKFERYLQAVEHPLSTLDDLEKGTLTTEHVEAIKTVYPALYNQIQQQLVDKIGSPEGQSMSYNKRVSLGILLDIPTDESLQPYAISALQSNFLPVDETPQPNQHAQPVNTSGMDIADRAQSGTEAIATRT